MSTDTLTKSLRQLLRCATKVLHCGIDIIDIIFSTSVLIAHEILAIICDSAWFSGEVTSTSDCFIILIMSKTNGLMTKTTIPFTLSHLKTPKNRYYMTRFAVMCTRPFRPRPRRWAFWSRRDRDETRDAEVRDRDETFWIRDETETETLQLPRPWPRRMVYKNHSAHQQNTHQLNS